MEACATAGVEYTLNPGEGAFYGPKLEFVLRDAIGRDCSAARCRSISCCRAIGRRVCRRGWRTHRPVMLHRAILGSFERFLAS